MITLIALSRLIPMKGIYRIMKTKLRNLDITKNRTRVALLLVLATSIIGLVPAFSSSARADYSINDVSGNYVWHAEGWDLGGTNGKQSVPLRPSVSLRTRPRPAPFTVT
jgi:hypothetical protein